VLPAWHDPGILKAAGKGERHCSHPPWLAAERAVADHWICGVRVDVEDRGEIAVETGCGEFSAHGAAGGAGEGGAVGVAEGPHGGPFGERGAEAGDAAAFLVDGDECVGAEEIPQLPSESDELGRGDDVAQKEDDAARLEALEGTADSGR